MRRSDFQLLRVAPFRRLWLARTISMLGSALTPVAFAFGVLDLPGAGARELAFVVSASSGAMLVTILAGGVLGDRFPRTRVLMAGESVAAISAATTAYLFITGTATVPVLAVLSAIAGGAEGLLFPVLSGVVPETVPQDRLQTANAFLRLSQSSAQIGGAALAGVLVASVGPGWTLALDALSFVIAVAIVSRIPPAVRGSSGDGLLKELRDGWRSFISFRWIWGTTFAATVWVGAFIGCFSVLGPVVAKSSLGGAKGWATVLAFFASGGVLGTFLATRAKPRRPMVVVALLFQPGALFVALLSIPAELPWILVGAVGMGVSFTLITVLWDTMLQTHVPPELLSRVASYDFLGSTAAVPIATAVIGSLAAAIGVQTTLEGAAVVMVVAGFGPLLVRDVWRIGLTKDEPAEAQPSSTI